MDDKPQFWLNLKTNQVESGPQSLSVDRIGPFGSAAEAAKGKEMLLEKARRLRDEDDADWKD